MTMTLDVAAIQTYISKSSGNSYSGMSASLSISEPAPSLKPATATLALFALSGMTNRRRRA